MPVILVLAPFVGGICTGAAAVVSAGSVGATLAAAGTIVGGTTLTASSLGAATGALGALTSAGVVAKKIVS